MTKDQVGGLVRTLLGIVAGFIINKGWVDAETMATIIGGITALVVAVWSIYTNRPSKIVDTATAQPKDILGAQAAKAAVK